MAGYNYTNRLQLQVSLHGWLLSVHAWLVTITLKEVSALFMTGCNYTNRSVTLFMTGYNYTKRSSTLFMAGYNYTKRSVHSLHDWLQLH